MPLIILCSRGWGKKVRCTIFGRLQIWSLFLTPIFNWTWLLADLTGWKCTINIVQTFSPQLQKESWPDRHSSSGHHPDEILQKTPFWKDFRMHCYIFQQQILVLCIGLGLSINVWPVKHHYHHPTSYWDYQTLLEYGCIILRNQI